MQHLPGALLLPITSEEEYDRAVVKLNELLDIERHRRLTVDEDTYLDILGEVIQAWDESQHPIPENTMTTPLTQRAKTDNHPLESPDMKHFLQLANAGWHSEAALAARELADCIVNNVPCLDEIALRGMCVFAGIAKMAPETGRNMLQD